MKMNVRRDTGGMSGAITSKKQTHGVGRNVLLHFIYSRGASRAWHSTGASRRKTDLGKSTLLFRLQRKGGTIGLPLIRNQLARLGSARLGLAGWLAGWLQLRETLFYPPIPRLSRLNAMEMVREGGGGREKKSAGCYSLMLHSTGPIPRAFSPVN